MKTTATQATDFKPVTLTIIFETKRELDLFSAAIINNLSINEIVTIANTNIGAGSHFTTDEVDDMFYNNIFKAFDSL